jgi:hypothetical protein
MKTRISLVLLLLCSANLFGAYNRATSTANGNITTTGNWSYLPTSPANPTNKDTLIIEHDMFWNANVNWSASSIDVIIIRNGGSLGPDGNNNTLTLPSGTQIFIDATGFIGDKSGNSSNHKLVLGSVCIWGKGCGCSGGNVAINGPINLNAANPCGFVILPVNVTSVYAKSLGSAIELNWSVSEEQNIAYYLIEKSSNGFDFETVGTVTATGGLEAKTYNFEDRSPINSPLVYYKLVAVSANGETSHSSILPVHSKMNIGISQSGAEITINPENIDGDFEYEFLDLQGKVIAAGVANNTTPVVASELTTGAIYLLRLSVAGQPVDTIKIIKE